MRHLWLALPLMLTSVALPARAEDEGPQAPDPAEKAEAAEAPEPIPCPVPPGLKGEAAAAFAPACSFLKAVAAREPQALSDLIHAPFFFEGKSVAGRDEVLKRWATLLGELRSTRATVYGVEIYSAEEMIKKYGKPPAKLDAVPLRGAMIAVGNIDGHATVLALRKDQGAWTVFAFHD
jgi:hypothetical protein